jgi:hypothetical protein
MPITGVPSGSISGDGSDDPGGGVYAPNPLILQELKSSNRTFT